MIYAVNEIYACLQGEGAKVGVPMALVRLQGCQVGCPFCDTKNTWALDPARLAPAPPAPGPPPALPAARQAWFRASGPTIAGLARDASPRAGWAMLTGGEPTEQNLAPLVAALGASGFRTMLETSGTANGWRGADVDWICLSPKLDMPGGLAVIPDVVALADEIKMVVGKAADLDAYDRMLDAVPARLPDQVLSLQPVWGSDKAAALCVRACQERGWNLSVQVHKYMGLR